MSFTPGDDPYVHSSPRPWWGNRFSGTSGGVKLSLLTDQRSEKPPFWEPRPVDTPATAPAASRSPLSPSPFPPPGIVPPASPPANTRSLESIRKTLALKDQHKRKQYAGSTDADGDSASNSNSNSSEKGAKPYFARQSTPGTPTSPNAGAYDYPYSQTYAHFRGRGRGRGRGRAAWPRGREPADGGHVGLNLDARAQEFVPGQQSTAVRGLVRVTEGVVDLNEYIRAGAGSETSTTLGSSRVSVFGSTSRSRSPSSVEEEREARSTERARQEAERQWHLQTSWDDDEHEHEHEPGDQWSGSAPGVATDPREARQEGGGEVRGEWERGMVSETVDIPAPAPLEFEPLVSAPATVKLPAPALGPAPFEPPVRPPSVQREARPAFRALPFGVLLERAQMIQEGARVAYPKEIKPPGAHMNASVNAHRLCYDRAFLLQFQHVCTGQPVGVPYIPLLWHVILAPYALRPTPPVRTKNKWVQAELEDDPARDSLLQGRGRRRTVDIGVETNQPSSDGDTSRIVDAIYNRLVPGPDDRDRPRSIGLGSRQSSLLSSELTCRATPSGDETGFEYEVQEAQRQRLEARVDYLAAEVRVLRLELARIGKMVTPKIVD